jgi:NADH:ubiquinone oxidoreductase subunit 6 (subunit J)
VLLSGAGTGAITSPALVAVSYVLGAMLLVGALATVLLRTLTTAIAGLVGTLVVAGVFYLLLGGGWPLMLVQVVVAGAGVGALTFLSLRWMGSRDAGASAFNSQLIPALLVGVAVTVPLGGVMVAASWPGAAASRVEASLWATLTNTYPVGLATLVVIVLTVAAGGALMLTRRVPERVRSAEPVGARPRRRRTRPDTTA